MIGPRETPVVNLLGTNGNAFAIMGAVSKALKKEGADKEYIDKFKERAMSGNHNHLITVALEYVEVM